MHLDALRLPASTWTELSTRHADRADVLTAGHRSRSARGERHAVEDFLFTYYNSATPQDRKSQFLPGQATSGYEHVEGWVIKT